MAPTWLQNIEALKQGEAAEFRSAASGQWLPATILVNGGGGYWTVELNDGRILSCHIERIRTPGDKEAWPR